MADRTNADVIREALRFSTRQPAQDRGLAALDGLLADLAAATERADRAESERDLIGAALGEECAECGHIDWRSDGYAEAFHARVEAQLAAAREALTDLEELRALVIEAYPGDSPTNYWRKRAEALNAWPGAALAVSPPDTGDTA